MQFHCAIWSSYVCDIAYFFFFKQKTAYEMRISDWSSDVCSSDLLDNAIAEGVQHFGAQLGATAETVAQIAENRARLDAKAADVDYSAFGSDARSEERRVGQE